MNDINFLDSNENPLRKKVIIAISILFLLAFFRALFQDFNHDELEHMHCVWYLANGYVPFADFFQNHNPFYWYLMVPVYNVFGESIASVILLRIFNFFFTVGIITTTYFVAYRISLSRTVALLSLFMILVLQFFVQKGVEVRPDLPQVLFGMLSILFYMLFYDKRKISLLFFSGLCLGLSFIFLQKAVFLVIALFLFSFYLLIKKEFSLKEFIAFSIGAALPVLGLILYLYLYDMIEAYYITNILVNANRLKSFPAWESISNFIDEDLFVYLVVLGSFYILFLQRKELDTKMKCILFIICIQLISLFFINNRPHGQSFLQLLPLICITSAWGISNGLMLFKFSQKKLFIVLVVLMLPPVVDFSLVFIQSKNNNLKELKKINFVLQNTEPTDKVYDGNIKFNVFRPDLHYFWYSLNKGKLLDSYNLVTDGKYADYDIYQLIKEQLPKIIHIYLLDSEHPFIKENYLKTEFKRLYKRKDK